MIKDTLILTLLKAYRLLIKTKTKPNWLMKIRFRHLLARLRHDSLKKFNLISKFRTENNLFLRY
jgi:hypothetical protein